MPAGVVALVRDLYAEARAGRLTDAEARWVLEIVLREYGLSLDDLARWARGARGAQGRGAGREGAGGGTATTGRLLRHR